MAVPSLRELSKLEVIKHGVDRTDLPRALALEVEQLEERIVTAFCGTYQRVADLPPFAFRVAWHQGQWEFILGNQEPFVVRAGVENRLGRARSDLFFLRGRKVIITDFRIDLDEGKLSFFGACSTNKSANNRALKIDLIRRPEELLVNTLLTSEEDDLYSKFKSSICDFHGGFLPCDSSDSSADSDSSSDEDF